MSQQNLPLWKQGVIQVSSGGTAGFVEVCIMHPLDLIKTRLQIQKMPPREVAPTDLKNYTGIVDCVRKMYKLEGPFSYWKGILPPICAETPKRALKFVCFEQYQKLFMFGSEKPTPLTFSLAGLSAGFTEAVLINPFEVVKVTMQANWQPGAQMPSTWAVTKQIYREHGWGNRGLAKGMTGTLMRNGLFNCVYFGFYHSFKNIVPAYKDPVAEFGRVATLGFIAGSTASIVNIPFDVGKSRIQGPQPVPGEVKYRALTQSMILVYHEEGFPALYKGLLPKILRLGPGGAIMLVVYDYVSKFLTKKMTIDN